MTIRKTEREDLPTVMKIYAEARKFMKENGNPNQWGDSRPAQEAIETDIEAGKSYVCLEEGEILAAFYFAVEPDPTYTKIDGSWLDISEGESYGVIHRIATGYATKGTGSFCINWCLSKYPSIKIDTHEANSPMRNLLEKLGFTYCGIIWLADGSERLAYQKHL